MSNLSRWGLVPELEAIVASFLDEFPESRVNDGRRDRALQADRMAGLVVAGEIRYAARPLPRGLVRWGQAVLAGGGGVRGTYLPSRALDAVVRAICLHPEVTDRARLAGLIGGVLAVCSDSELDGLSKHLSGRAADLQRLPPGVRWELAQAWWSSQQTIKVLYEEGGMPRLHVQLRG